MLSYDLKTTVDNLVRELRPYDVIRQRYLIKEILAQMIEELGQYILEFFEEGCRDLRKDD